MPNSGVCLCQFYLLAAIDTLKNMCENSDSDEALMLRYAKGDATAFDALYTRHKGALYRYILKLCMNQAIAEELFQEVWMKVINARKNYSVSAKFTTYLYKLAHNHFIDHYRRQSVRIVSDATQDMDEFESDHINLNPEKQAQLDQDIDKFTQAVETLPKEQREVFLLKEEAGMSLQQISETLSVNQEAVKSRLRYAFNKLRNALVEI